MLIHNRGNNLHVGFAQEPRNPAVQEEQLLVLRCPEPIDQHGNSTFVAANAPSWLFFEDLADEQLGQFVRRSQLLRGDPWFPMDA